MGESDHLTMLNAYNSWIQIRKQGRQEEFKFLWDNFLSRKTLVMIESVRRQLAELLADIEFISKNLINTVSDGRNDDFKLIKALLVSALYPNVVKIEPEGGKKFKLSVQTSEQVFIHPTSIHSKSSSFPSTFIMFLEKVKTSRVYIRDATTVSPLALALFGGRLYPKKNGTMQLDNGWIQFSCKHDTGVLLKLVRNAFDEVLSYKIANPKLDLSNIPLVRELISIISTAN
jgi:HrpA-like RNA helicase